MLKQIMLQFNLKVPKVKSGFKIKCHSKSIPLARLLPNISNRLALGPRKARLSAL